MQIQTNYVDGDRSQLYERAAAALNNKAESFLSIYIDAVNVGKTIAHMLVTQSSTLYVVSLAAECETAGSNDGAVGLTIRFSGGSANLDVPVLAKNATLTTDPQSSSVFGAPGYLVPSGGTLVMKEQADDHVASAPAKIRLTVGLRVV
jgi:hypothetical protein